MAKNICSVEQCNLAVHAQHLCNLHYRRWFKTGDVGPLDWIRSRGGRTCTVDGCTHAHRSNGLCQMHISRLRDTGELGPAERIKGAPGTPWLNNNGYWMKVINGRETLIHRHVMSEMLGRPLRTGENVHHRNGWREDNRPENLELWTTHQPKGQRVADLVAFVVGEYRTAVLAALEDGGD